MNLNFQIALRHLLARKRQSLVSLTGIILGVAFFLAISSMMQGSEADFIRRLVDNSPHITLQDEYRDPHEQPLNSVFPQGAIELKHVRPLAENRGIRGYQQVLEHIQSLEGITAAAVLTGQGLLSISGEEVAITLNGMNPSEIGGVTTLKTYMKKGSIEALEADANGIIIGAGLAKTQGIELGDTLSMTAAGGARVFKVVGIFQTGRQGYDTSQAYITLTRAQTLLNRPNRANSIIMKLNDSTRALTVAQQIETAVGYKAISWQEASADIMNTLLVRNLIMYTVVSSVLLVAALGIYNVISTVVMEKQRDIAILKSIGFEGWEVKRIFLWQGLLLGTAGAGLGIPLGCLFMLGLMQIKFKPPGGSEVVSMPLSWGMSQFIIAAAFALSAALLAAYLPARKGAKIAPVDVLRGGM